MRRWFLLLWALAIVLASIGCASSKGGGATATRTVARPTPAATTVSGTQGPITIQIVEPADGAKVSNPFNLRVQATGIQIAAASEQMPGAAHFHAFLDQDPLPEGQRIPTATDIYHFTDSVQVRASPGPHTLTVVLGDNAHVRLRGAPTATVSFTAQ